MSTPTPTRIHAVFTLLSGGADSSTTLAVARHDFPDDPIYAWSMDYGQRHSKEMKCAKKIAQHFGAHHFIQPLHGLMTGMLVDKGDDNEVIPNASYADLPEGISPTYVSFRNGLMLSVLAAKAQAFVMATEAADSNIEASATLYCGVHADDGANWAYPDCTPEFIGAMSGAILVGTYNKVRLRAPLQYMSKADVIREGVRYDVPFEDTWSCYVGGEKHCGVCPTCRSRKEAFELNGLLDPTAYEA